MRHAINLAEKAEAQGEVPVGAVIVKDGQVIGEGWNQVITLSDPSAHAEVLALRQAGQAQQNYRIVDATLYVTLEPCPMCVGALVHARIKRLVFGANDPKTGVVESVRCYCDEDFLNHHIEHQGGVLADQCSAQISAFFKKRRAAQKADSAASFNKNG